MPHLGLLHVVYFLLDGKLQVLQCRRVHDRHIFSTNKIAIEFQKFIHQSVCKNARQRKREGRRDVRVPMAAPSSLRTEMRMALPNSRLMSVSTSDKVGFLGTSARIGSSSSAARVEFNLTFFTLLLW